jgi:hypothetical protein
MPKFTEVTGRQIRHSLARRFVPLADMLRNILTTFGLRVYRVALVTIQWSGGERGVGTPTVVRETPLLPTPKLMDMATLAEIVHPIGLDEVGGVVVGEISGTYTEDQLLGLDSEGADIPDDTEFFYEIEFPHPDGKPGIKRRFFPNGVPNYSPGGLQWTVHLEKAHDDRDRRGDP